MSSTITPDIIKKIVHIPKIAWPTVILCFSCAIVEVLVILALYNNLLSKYLAFSLNIPIIFAVFTPMHDSSHGSVATSQFSWLNTVVGYVAAACFPIPYPAFKRLHLLHHKHTNEDDDPGEFFLLCFVRIYLITVVSLSRYC